MAKCRNCKKEIDVTATKCPYCHTQMPTNNYLGQLKSNVIGILTLTFVAFVFMYLVTYAAQSIDLSDLLPLTPITITLGAFMGVSSIYNLKNAKKLAEENPSTTVNEYIRGGILGIVISLVLIILSFSAILS